MTFSTRLRRVEYVNHKGEKYTGYIDSYKPGWPENEQSLLGPGPGILNYEATEKGYNLHTNLYLSNEETAIKIEITQTYSSIDENGDLQGLSSTTICSDSPKLHSTCFTPDELSYDYRVLDDSSNPATGTLHHNEHEFMLSILPETTHDIL